MTFLNPALLWGLLGLSVPIIIHFFNLQRPKEVLFSNVAFVKEVKQTVVRRMTFKRWLLLLTRLLAVAGIVLAFANPVIINENQPFLQGNRSVAIVVDNSASMQASNEKGAYFQQALSLSRNIAKAYSKQDDILIMPLSKPKLNYNFSSQEEAIAELGRLGIKQNTRSHLDLLNLSSAIFDRASYGLKELYFISDFQSSTVMTSNEEVPPLDSNLLVKYIPLSTRNQRNAYIKDHRIESSIIERNQPVSLSLTLVNDGDQPIRDLSVRVMLEGKVAAISNTELEPESNQTFTISFTPPEAGWLSGYIEIDDNPIDFDNKRYFSLYVPESEKVLYLEGSPLPNLKILYQDLFAQFDTDIRPIRDASGIQLDAYKSVILAGVNELSSGFIEKLKTFLSSGASLMIIPGNQADIPSLNQLLGQLQVGNFQALQTIESGVKASQVDLKHPVFQGIYSQRQNNQSFDAPLTFKYYPLSPNNQLIQSKVISLENGAPFLLMSSPDQGLVYTFTSFPGEEWTDLSLKSIFAPLFFRLTQTMNQTQAIDEGQEIGNVKPRRIRSSNQALIQLVDQEGNTITPEQYIQGGATNLDFSKMNLSAGNYRLVQENELLEKISFNISDQESQLSFVTGQALQDKLSDMALDGVQFLDANPTDIASQIQKEKEGIPLWKYFILAAILFLVCEIVLLTIGKRSA